MRTGLLMEVLKMFEMVYMRKIANVVDLRVFGSTIEMENWLRLQKELEPIDILDIRKV